MKATIKNIIGFAALLSLAVLFSIGYAKSMSDLWEHSFDGARRICIYGNGIPIDERQSDGRMFAVRCKLPE